MTHAQEYMMAAQAGLQLFRAGKGPEVELCRPNGDAFSMGDSFRLYGAPNVTGWLWYAGARRPGLLIVNLLHERLDTDFISVGKADVEQTAQVTMEALHDAERLVMTGDFVAGQLSSGLFAQAHIRPSNEGVVVYGLLGPDGCFDSFRVDDP